MEQFFTDYLELLHKLHTDFIAAFDGLPAEALDWVPGEDMNSFCVLVVHTTGATRFWIGAALDDVPDRDRAAEFRAHGLSADQLKAHFAAVEDYAQQNLGHITLADMGMTRTIPRPEPVTVAWALLHALEHVGLHLGHAQITRQLWDQR
ncbi:MAG: DinB family protein [Anaerolineae bacterium]|nr:DinB family protein [Anaerolineae bacterium]